MKSAVWTWVVLIALGGVACGFTVGYITGGIDGRKQQDHEDAQKVATIFQEQYEKNHKQFLNATCNAYLDGQMSVLGQIKHAVNHPLKYVESDDCKQYGKEYLIEPYDAR